MCDDFGDVNGQEESGAPGVAVLGMSGRFPGANGPAEFWANLRAGREAITVIAEAPKVNPHREAMKQRIAAALRITPDRVGVKATTNERLGFVGREEGVAAMAVACVSVT